MSGTRDGLSASTLAVHVGNEPDPVTGAMAPPCQRPSGPIRSTVMAVPHETTCPGPRPPCRASAARTARARSAPVVAGVVRECARGTSAAER